MKTAQYIFLFLFLVLSPISSAFTLYLDETDIGKAIINEDIDGYRKAWDALKRLPYQKASEILTATDHKGNNILHLMAQVKKSREAFAGEILQLSVILIDDFDNHDMFEAVNKQELSPKELAIQEGNSLAAEYLTTASNRVKKMRNVAFNVVERTEKSKKSTEVMVPSSMPGRYGVAGIVLALNGGLFISTGLAFGDPLILTVGVVEAFAGVRMCQEAFKIKTNSRSGNMQK